MKSIPVEGAKLPKLCAPDNTTKATQYKYPLSQEKEEWASTSLTRQGSRTSGRCERDSSLFTGGNSMNGNRQNRCEKQPDCTVVADQPSTNDGNTSCTRHKVIRTRSKQTVNRPVGSGLESRKLKIALTSLPNTTNALLGRERLMSSQMKKRTKQDKNPQQSQECIVK